MTLTKVYNMEADVRQLDGWKEWAEIHVAPAKEENKETVSKEFLQWVEHYLGTEVAEQVRMEEDEGEESDDEDKES